MIRMLATDVSTYSRTAQGVRMMKTGESKVISLALAERAEEEPAE